MLKLTILIWIRKCKNHHDDYVQNRNLRTIIKLQEYAGYIYFNRNLWTKSDNIGESEYGIELESLTKVELKRIATNTLDVYKIKHTVDSIVDSLNQLLKLVNNHNDINRVKNTVEIINNLDLDACKIISNIVTTVEPDGPFTLHDCTSISICDITDKLLFKGTCNVYDLSHTDLTEGMRY